MSMDRRRFLNAALVGAGGVLLDGTASLAQAPSPFALRPLGQTGLNVSLIGAGTGMRGWMRNSNQTRAGKESFSTLIRHAYERGVRVFDCADLYGTHPYLAEALTGVPREDYVIITKIWWQQRGLPEQDRPGPKASVERFRQELRTDYVDLVLLHCVTDPNWQQTEEWQMDELSELKSDGVIRAHGVSVHSIGALESCISSPWVDSVNARINAYGDKMDDRDPAVVAEVLKRLHDAGKGVVGMKLIGEGQYRDDPLKRDESIKYVLGLGSVDTMVVGFEKPEEIDDFADRVANALAAQ